MTNQILATDQDVAFFSGTKWFSLNDSNCVGALLIRDTGDLPLMPPPLGANATRYVAERIDVAEANALTFPSDLDLGRLYSLLCLSRHPAHRPPDVPYPADADPEPMDESRQPGGGDSPSAQPPPA